MICSKRFRPTLLPTRTIDFDSKLAPPTTQKPTSCEASLEARSGRSLLHPEQLLKLEPLEQETPRAVWRLLLVTIDGRRLGKRDSGVHHH